MDLEIYNFKGNWNSKLRLNQSTRCMFNQAWEPNVIIFITGLARPLGLTFFQQVKDNSHQG